MPKPHEYVALSRAVYAPEGGVPPEGWRTEMVDYPNNRWGLGIAVYANDATRELVVSFRGTEMDNIWNLFTDVGLWQGQLPPHIDHVEHFVEQRVRPQVERRAIQMFMQDMAGLFNENVLTELLRWLFTGLAAIALIIRAGLDIGSLFTGTGLDPAIIVAIAVATGHRYLRPEAEGLAIVAGELREGEPAEFDDAFRHFMEVFPGYTLSFTGHSLGAVFAELMACRFRVHSVTFDSPGSLPLIESDERYQMESYDHMTTYLSAPNPINTLHPHVGHLLRLYISHLDGVGENVWHGVKSIGASVMRGGAYALTAFGIFSGVGAVVGGGGAAIAAGGGGATAAAAGGGASVTAGIGSTIAIGSLATLGVVGVELWSEIAWIMRQHSIENIASCFNFPETLLPTRCSRMMSWPLYSILRPASKGVFRALIDNLKPLPDDRPGIRMMFSPDEMHEKAIVELEQYAVAEEFLLDPATIMVAPLPRTAADEVPHRRRVRARN